MPVSTKPAGSAHRAETRPTSDADPGAYEILRADMPSGLIFLCDHGGQRIPSDLAHYDWRAMRDLHIAYDIGAAHMTRYLSRRFNAPAVIGVYSRLVVDLNRFRHDPTYMPGESDGIAIPANIGLSAAEIDHRTDRFFAPYHMAVSHLLDKMLSEQSRINIVLIHSMTPEMNGQRRREDAEIMFAEDDRLGRPLLAAPAP